MKKQGTHRVCLNLFLPACVRLTVSDDRQAVNVVFPAGSFRFTS